MRNNFKLGLKLLRYEGNVGRRMIFMTVELAAGLILEILDKLWWKMGVSGDIIMVCAAVSPVGLAYSLSGLGIVMSSPVQKQMLTSVSTAVSVCSMLAVYLLCSLVNGIFLLGHPGYTGVVCSRTVVVACFAVFMMLFLRLYRSSWMLILECIVCFTLAITKNRLQFAVFENREGAFAQAVAVGAAVILLGGTGQYVLSLLICRRAGCGCR